MLKKLIFILFLSHCLASMALPLPPNLIAYDAKIGQKLLLDSEYKEGFWILSKFFTTQKTRTYCGIASLVMVLNALQVTPPPDAVYYPYKIFNQENVFTFKIRKIVSPDQFKIAGISLEQLAEVFQAFGLSTKVFHTKQLNLSEFRELAAQAVNDANQAIIVNYYRPVLGQKTAGHHSPLAAYNRKADRFLILDVARFKYPPVWAKTAELWAAMHTKDGRGLYRGFILIQKNN
jgi:hypothetical protein